MNPALKQKTEQIRARVRRAWKRYSYLRLTALLLLPAAVFLVFFTLQNWLESGYYFSPVVKIFLLMCGLAAGLTAFRFIRKKLPHTGFRTYYESSSRSLNLEALRNLLDLSSPSVTRTTRLSDAAIRQNLEQMEEVDFPSKLGNFNRNSPPAAFLRYGLFVALIPLMLIPLLIHFHPDAIIRSALFWRAYDRPNPFTFVIVPGNSILEQGAHFRSGPTSMEMKYLIT
jgi:hypothetical protein